MERSVEHRDHRTPEVKLWRAVLAAAASDAIDENILDYKGNFILPMNRRIAQDYFLNPTRHFYTVCNYAGMDPEYVLRKMNKVIKERKQKCQEK